MNCTKLSYYHIGNIRLTEEGSLVKVSAVQHKLLILLVDGLEIGLKRCWFKQARAV